MFMFNKYTGNPVSTTKPISRFNDMIYTNMNPLQLTPKFPMTVLYLQFILIYMQAEVAAQCLLDDKNILAANIQTCHLHSGVEPRM